MGETWAATVRTLAKDGLSVEEIGRRLGRTAAEVRMVADAEAIHLWREMDWDQADWSLDDGVLARQRKVSPEQVCVIRREIAKRKGKGHDSWWRRRVVLGLRRGIMERDRRDLARIRAVAAEGMTMLEIERALHISRDRIRRLARIFRIPLKQSAREKWRGWWRVADWSRSDEDLAAANGISRAIVALRRLAHEIALRSLA